MGCGVIGVVCLATARLVCRGGGAMHSGTYDWLRDRCSCVQRLGQMDLQGVWVYTFRNARLIAMCRVSGRPMRSTCKGDGVPSCAHCGKVVVA